MIEIFECFGDSEARRLCPQLPRRATSSLDMRNEDGAIIGCAALIHPSQCTSASCAGVNVGVLPEHRKRGIGGMLV